MIEFFHVSDLHFNRKKSVKEFLARIKDKFGFETNARGQRARLPGEPRSPSG